MADIEIEIDGQKLTAQPEQTVMQVADAAGIYIPRFCYHKHLSIAANCRMCLVEVEKSPKTVPACATPVAPGMKVFTRSKKTIDAQRAVMEFLLINHPLDCPICDQGGECELQDLSMGYGADKSNYTECKRSIADENLGPLIATEMTRCIYCTRCVRFGMEIAGVRELGGTYRGENTEIGTFVAHTITSEVSGNIIDLCPVGALTSKPFRFTARAWELNQFPGISPHDCLGSNLHIHTRCGEVMRVVSQENAAINETWISDRDRFSYTGLHHPERLEEPLARINGKLEVVEWQKALELAAAGLQAVIAQHGSDKLGALASPSSTLEEFYLLQKIIRGLGSPHIDHRLREIDTKDQTGMPAFPGLTMPLAELERCDAIILIGSNLRKEQPLAALRVRKAAVKGSAAVLAVNAIDYDFNFPVQAKLIKAPHKFVDALVELNQALANGDENHAMVSALRGKQKVCILLGAFAQHHPQASAIRAQANQLAQAIGASLNFLTDGANSAGGWLAGAIPHRQPGGVNINHTGFSAYEMLEKARKGYLLLNVEPDLDCANAAKAVESLQQAQFVVALSLYRNSVLDEHADVILPMASFTETSGTYVNAAGEWQSFKGAAKGHRAARPAWKILRVLGNYLQLPGFEYESSEEVKHEVKHLVDKMQPVTVNLSAAAHEPTNMRFSRIGDVPLYAIDSLVRHAKPLQDIQPMIEGDLAVARLHPETAEKLRIQDGERVTITQHGKHLQLPVMLDARVAQDAAAIAGGIAATAALGDLIGEIEIQKV